jgi:orotate phosphoribosyltransferase
MTTSPRARLIEIVRAKSFQSGVEMKLASGRTSSFYFNMKPTMLDPEGATLVGQLLHEVVAGAGAEWVGGLELGAVPLATAVAIASHAAGRPIPAFFVRKQAKEHGTQSLVDGLPRGATLAGRRVAILEDVTTTGGSAMKAIEAVKAAGATVALVVTVVDRQEGATASFAAAGVPFTALLTTDDFR